MILVCKLQPALCSYVLQFLYLELLSKSKYMKTYKIILSITLFSIFLSSCNLDEGGVRVSNNMEKYALEYISDNQLLNNKEKILAYYDITLALDGTECAFITNSRLVYHKKETYTTSIKLKDIIDIKHRDDGFPDGFTIEVTAKDGVFMIIEIAAWNDAEIFLKLLKSKANF